MTDEKKNGDIAEVAEDKGSGSDMNGADMKAEEKTEEKVENESIADAGSEDIRKEEAVEASPVPETGELKETEMLPEKSDEVKVKDIKNLNFYPELRTDIPDIKPGDVLKVYYRVVEGGKERIQIFEGITIALKNSGITRTITVRKTSFGIAIERIFPLNSKLVQKIEVIKHSKVRRAKLYYLRKLKGKAARLKELR